MSFTLRPSWEMCPQYPLYRGPGGFHSRPGRSGKAKNTSPCREPTPDLQDLMYITSLTEMFLLNNILRYIYIHINSSKLCLLFFCSLTVSLIVRLECLWDTVRCVCVLCYINCVICSAGSDDKANMH